MSDSSAYTYELELQTQQANAAALRTGGVFDASADPATGPSDPPIERHTTTYPTAKSVHTDMKALTPAQEQLDRRTRQKLDFILLPFLSLLFLLNALDKSNVGNAEAAHFTKDLGLPPSALNKSVAWFFAFFVALQPVGAALGRRFGMARYVPTVMALWGVCTALHVAVRAEWQLIGLRVLVAALEAGFYPTTVSYLSLFYTRYEFAKRLGFFYGQAALAGAMGGLLSWFVFEHFPDDPKPHGATPATPSALGSQGWRSWEVLFLIEGCCTIVVALVGFLWLPHSADSAWFLTEQEREWAETRIRRDRNAASLSHHEYSKASSEEDIEDHTSDQPERYRHVSAPVSDNAVDDEEDEHLLAHFSHHQPIQRKASMASTKSMTADSGLSKTDIFSALLDWKIWYLLFLNVLSAIPTTAFSVFLPLVIRGLTSSKEDMAAARANLLAIPPFLAGATALFIFTWYSDRTHKRLTPVLYGLGILLAGLTATVLLPTHAPIARYIALTVLLSGSFIASPLTIAWLTNNIPEPGKRAVVLGINGWGNLAGVFSAMLFAPRFAKEGYITPFFITIACVGVAFVGYLFFRVLLVAENRRRDRIVRDWSDDELDREAWSGDVHVEAKDRGVFKTWFTHASGVDKLLAWAELDTGRRGDEKLTFRYGM